MAEDFEREEKAFTAALRNAADAESFRPLDPGEFTTAPERVRPPVRLVAWGKGIAAAAAAAVVITGLALGIARLVGPDAATSVSAGGGQDQSVSEPAAAERAMGDWVRGAQAPLSPRSHAAGGWLDGRFYVVGGQMDPPCPAGAQCVAPSRLYLDGASYDPVTDDWRMIAPAPGYIADTAGVAVAGRLYFHTFANSGASLVSYDPGTDTWTTLTPHAGHGTLVAAGDRLISIGSSDENTAAVDEVYDPATGAWTALPEDPLGPSFDREAVWVNGTLLLAGKELGAGSASPPRVRLAEFDQATRTWRRLPDSDVIGSGAVTVGDLVVWPEPGSADGGEVGNWGRSYAKGGIYDPVAGRWTDLPAGPTSDGVASSRPGASVSGGLLLASGHLLDPATRTWTSLTPPPAGNLEGQSVIAGPEGLLVFGGWNSERHTAGTAYLRLR